VPNAVKLVVYPVKDLTRAKTVYVELLGTQPYVDGPYYVGFRPGDIEVGLTPSAGVPGQSGPIPYVDVNDIKGSLAALAQAGATVVQNPRDVGGGLLVALAKDADGNSIGLRQS
jgi:predicted enzyme related to lactoylglutathione lyase